MELWLWLVFGVMALLILALLIKIHLLQKAADEIAYGFMDRLASETNTLIDISCHDRHMRYLASTINVQLRRLREQRHRFVQGDLELKNAVTNISHDLRTPLTVITGYLELLEPEPKSETSARYLAYIGNRIEALRQLTEELFRYTIILSADEPELENIDIKAVLEESLLNFYDAMAKRSIVPEITLPEQQIIRSCSHTSLSRVFSNILNNALKYSDGDLSIQLSDTGVITFRNTTSHLDEIQVGKLFHRFFTVESARDSTGLGLSIAKTLVEQMGGEISAKYKDNQLSIILWFPS